MNALLAVRDLRTHFFTVDGVTRAVDGVSFDLFPGETLGIVGESGCGKSVTALSIMRLLPPRLARTVDGSVTFENRDLVVLEESEMRKLPFHVKPDHLGEIRGGDCLVEGRPSFGFIERLPDRFARKLDAERLVEREETIEPMQAVTIESAAHVEENCTQHAELSDYHSARRN